MLLPPGGAAVDGGGHYCLDLAVWCIPGSRFRIWPSSRSTPIDRVSGWSAARKLSNGHDGDLFETHLSRTLWESALGRNFRLARHPPRIQGQGTRSLSISRLPVTDLANCRGRDDPHWSPPAQIRTSAFTHTALTVDG